MNSLSLLLLIILVSALPVILLFTWLKLGNSDAYISLPWFLLALAAGIVSLSIAALIQNLFPAPGIIDSIWMIFFAVFIRIAFVEETSRLFTLFPVIKAGNKYQDPAFAAALGFAAGLGFAAAENALYGMEDFNLILLRIVTAAPLHAACGIRTGAAVFYSTHSPVRAIFLYLSAIIIHGAYNLIIISPAIPSFLGIPTALAALVVSLPMLKTSSDS